MKEEMKRDYSLTDSELCMFVSNLVQKITRDASLFSARNVNAQDIADLETRGNEFEVFPSDSFYQADVSIAVQAKDDTRSALEVKVRDVVQCAVIKWGAGSPQYKKFGAVKMTNADDMKFLTICRQVIVAASGYLGVLTDVGLTQAMIDEVGSNAQTFEYNMNAVRNAVETRDIKTAERITKGNELYSFVSRYCMIGKVIWDDVDEAKYNDYIIYNKTPTLPSKVQNLEYDVPTMTAGWDAAANADSYELEYKMHAPEASWEVAYEGAERSVVHDPGAGSWLYRCRGVNAEGTGEWSDELVVLIPI